MAKLDPGELNEFKAGFKGEVFVPGDAGYDDARTIWNAMIDKRPAVIARCTGTSDVVQAVNFARDSGLPLAIRSGGHNIAGSALCDEGLVVDLSRMKEARVDTSASRVTIGAGATLGDLDAATLPFGLATPVGINSTTGLAGLTLGGGFGWLSRKYGMTVDNLVSAEVVTAAGKVVTASETENPDLFWALRGGGGNFGVVTRFEFRLHPVGPEVLSGLIVYPIDQAKSVLQQYRKFMATAPDELSVWAVMRKAPPLPFLPESVHGTGVLVLAALLRRRSQAGRDPDRAPAHLRHARRRVRRGPAVRWPGSRPSIRSSPRARATTGSPTTSPSSRTSSSTPSWEPWRPCPPRTARSSSRGSEAPPSGRLRMRRPTPTGTWNSS